MGSNMAGLNPWTIRFTALSETFRWYPPQSAVSNFRLVMVTCSVDITISSRASRSSMFIVMGRPSGKILTGRCAAKAIASVLVFCVRGHDQQDANRGHGRIDHARRVHHG